MGRIYRIGRISTKPSNAIFQDCNIEVNEKPQAVVSALQPSFHLGPVGSLSTPDKLTQASRVPKPDEPL